MPSDGGPFRVGIGERYADPFVDRQNFCPGIRHFREDGNLPLGTKHRYNRADPDVNDSNAYHLRRR